MSRRRANPLHATDPNDYTHTLCAERSQRKRKTTAADLLRSDDENRCYACVQAALRLTT